jgi:sec-independent protein translocase protein TatB
MEILGIGASELAFIILIAIIILGPKDMQKAGKSIGRWLNQLVKSDGWKVFQRTSSEIRNLPQNLMREANMEMQDLDKDMRRSIDPRPRPPTAAPGRSAPPVDSSPTPPQAPTVNSDDNNTDAN